MRCVYFLRRKEENLNSVMSGVLRKEVYEEGTGMIEGCCHFPATSSAAKHCFYFVFFVSFFISCCRRISHVSVASALGVLGTLSRPANYLLYHYNKQTYTRI